MINEEMLKAWKKWTDPMLSEQHREKVPVDSLYFKAFQAGWESAVDAQVTRMAYEIESLEQQLREERKRVDAVNISQERVDETAKREHEWVGLDGEIPGLGLVTEEFYNGMLFAEDYLREKNT